MDIRSFIRDVPDFPKKGIVFKDITPLLKEGGAFRSVIGQLADASNKWAPKKIVAIESRGFIFGAALAQQLGVGFVPVRKKGKLPWKTVGVTYDLEYGTDTLEIHTDAVSPGENVLLVDDVLATGGTAKAACDLIRKSGANVVGAAFVIELTFLNGRDKIKDIPLASLLRY
ncbi:MAG TPA: adenine phosphoribosyltransferase [Elusimicrobiota bacterium]|nr:adenine phosphoribosyltransferase [Elusimicrobiota bacterium]